MRTALDSSVLLDVIVDAPLWAARSGRALSAAMQEGSLIIGESVLAEVVPALGTELIGEFLADWQIQFIPSTAESALLAGAMFAKYLERSGQARRVLPDFLIGAHAFIHADRLLARDRGYYRDYFDGLTVIEPKAAGSS
ncbi:MAG: type II toxin-antitoxin system VapC family toxin [Chthoniobacterales bacterium]|nr:type II toxin-antitoxin system VapC family toxin [Chthoniobacterales bacterium]